MLQLLLAADRGGLRRCDLDGLSALHLAAAANNTAALTMVLGSGPPHLADAINVVAMEAPTPENPTPNRITPLHRACHSASWDSALALLAAGACVDIAGHR
jgi:ankyrin repeat protein